MKALLLISTMGAGGAERALSELAGFLVAKGWSVTLATFEEDAQQDFYPLDSAVRRLRLGNPSPSSNLVGKLLANLERTAALRRALKQERPDVVLSFMDSTNVLALLASRRMRLPVIAAERTDPSQHLHHVPKLWRAGRRLTYRRAARVVAQTQAAADWLHEHCGCAVVVIPNALRRLPAPAAQREPVIMSAGRLDAAKGFDIVLRAFARLAPAHPGWRLSIAGDGPLKQPLQQLTAELGLQDRVEWLGRRKDLEQLMGQAAIVAQASRYEGFPNVVLEALGMGAAVVSTDCRSGPSELIEDGRNGLLVPVDDVEALAGRLDELMRDARARARLGASAMQVRSRFAQAQVLGRWEQLMRDCIGETARC